MTFTTMFRAMRAPAAVLLLAFGAPSVSAAPAPEAVDTPQLSVLRSKPQGPALTWRWPEFSVAEYTATGLAAVTAIAMQSIEPPGDTWRRTILFDDAARGAMRIGTETGRRISREVSDVILTLSVAYPFVVDSLVVAGWYRESPDVAAQMALINAEVLTVTMALQGISNLVGRRERPYVQECGLGDVDARGHDCTSDVRVRSFFSGHTAATFAAAAVTCSHHMALDLYGSELADGVACASGLVLAGTAGILRMTADMHYASDVMLGAVVGTLVGFGIPWLFHYGQDVPEPGDDGDDGLGATIHLVPAGLGAAAIGTF